MDDPDLQLLRSFRAEEAEPPLGMQARIEERLWQAIMLEESSRASGRSARQPGWFQRLLRPLVAAGAAATLALGVAIASDGGSSGPGSLGQGMTVQQAGAGVLDSTANSLFGGTSTTPTPIMGRIDLTDGDERLIDGPRHDSSGSGLEDGHADLVRDLSRDPDELLQAVRSSIASSGVRDPGDAVAFHVAMRWVVDPAVPVDLRAAMLRSVEGVDGIDDALVGTDVLGRSGIVVGQLDRASGIRSQYVLDPTDGSLFEVRAFMTTYLDPACPPGTVTMHAAYDDAGERVDPSAAQWVAWPQVVEACSPTVLVSS